MVDLCVSGPQEVASSEPSKYSDFPLSVLSSDDDIVTFTISQKWTNDCSVEWISTSYDLNENDNRCDTEKEVIPDQAFTYTAFCVDKTATVSVFVHDHSFNATGILDIPNHCTQFSDRTNTVRYDFEIPCGCDSNGTQPPTLFDTCSPNVVSFNDKDLSAGAYVALQWSDVGITVSGQSDNGGYLPDGQLRLFDTSNPVNATGFGTPELSGSYGNVLIIQQSGGSDQWKANSEGGEMMLSFTSPKDILELGLLNVGTDIIVRATDATGSIHSFLLSGSNTGVKNDLVMDTPDVTQITVSASGPFALTHITLCGGNSVVPTSAPIDRCVAGIQHNDAIETALFAEMPILVEESDDDTVTFSLSQKWLDYCSVRWLATHYHTTSTDPRCDVEYEVVPDQSFQYTAACVDGSATIAVYVHNSSLNTTDTTNAPSMCGLGDNGLESAVQTFSVPCGCPPDSTSSSVAASDDANDSCDLYDLTFDDKSFTPGAYVSLQWSDHKIKFTGKELDTGSGGFIPEGHLRLFDTSTAINSDGYGTSDLKGTYGNVLIIQEADRAQWKANEAGGVVDITFAAPASELNEIGLLNVVKDVSVRVTSNDGSVSNFLVTAAGAGSYKVVVIDKRNVVAVELVLSGPTAITHIAFCEERDNTKVPSLAPTLLPSTARAQNEVTCNKDVVEDYETEGQSDSWENGSEYDDPVFTTFLGRLGLEHPQVSKVFTVPEEADSIDLTFEIYDIDGMPGDDRVLVGIQGSYVDLNLFNSDGSKKYYNDIEVTGSLQSTRRISFKYDYDTVYSVTMRVPKYWYKDYNYKLPISFKIETSKTISSESYGVDNLRLHANCMRRALEDVAPVDEPDENGSDNPFYCSSNDFPCEGGNGMVYVCHYSARKGYETFCVPEPDSEILRFYSNDYCGPCVGGFGIHQQQLQK